MGLGGQHHAPANLPPVKTRYPLYRRMCGPQAQVWTGAENLAFTGIRSPTVQPVAIRYTDWAILAPDWFNESVSKFVRGFEYCGIF